MVEFEYLMSANIFQPYIVFTIHRESMGHDEDILTPRGDWATGLSIKPNNGYIFDWVGGKWI